MKIERMTEIETSDIEVGDRIHFDHYTATCQEITSKGALFLMDQYLDKPMVMNRNNSNKGGYEESDLRKALQSEWVLNIFKDIRDHMVPFENGDLLRIPFHGEIFGQEDAEYFEPDGCEQWPLMQARKNRLAFRQNGWGWGWIQNKSNYYNASISRGVRPVFMIATYREEAETCHS